jgi:uncharacterized protein involved in tellurium resistance
MLPLRGKAMSMRLRSISPGAAKCGSLHGRPRPLGLELGCFYRLEDGRREIIQSRDGYGQFDTAPFVHLMHSEDNGARGDQKLRINGARWSSIAEVTLCAFLRSDAPNWRTASLSITVSAVDAVDGAPPQRSRV